MTHSLETAIEQLLFDRVAHNRLAGYTVETAQEIVRLIQPSSPVNADLLALHEWMREPDWAENFSLENIADWINRRPTHITARLSASAQGAASPWQLIETAPKDGTEIIGIHFREWEGMSPSVYGPWTVAFNGKKWRSSWDGCEVVEYMSDFGTEYKEPDCDPTHWMPLPAGPAVTSPERGQP